MTSRHRISILAAGLFAFANLGFTSAAEPICAYPRTNEVCIYTDTAKEGVVGVVLNNANGVSTGAVVDRYCDPFSGTEWVYVTAGAGDTVTTVPVDTGQAC